MESRKFFVVAGRVLVLFGIASIGYSSAAVAQTGAVEPYQEYSKRLRAAEQISPLETDAFGEKVGLFNGQTEFSNIDIDIPGNNALPVQLGRRLPVTPQPAVTVLEQFGGVGNWDIDVPFIAGIFDSHYGWNLDSLGQPRPRCSTKFYPTTSSDFRIRDIFSGYNIHLPGVGDRSLLAMEPNSTLPVPNDGQVHNWTTTQLDSITCTATTANGFPGEGFVLRTTSGITYTFNIGLNRNMGPMRKGSFTNRPRIKTFLLASKIEDRFGNKVEYTYNGNGYPTSITSNDGRAITLVYSGDRLSTATANGHQWSYGYTTGGLLSQVTRPDASTWAYTYDGSMQLLYQPWDVDMGSVCLNQPPVTDALYGMTVTHPSGAVGSFSFEHMRHYRSGVAKSNCVIDVPGTGSQPNTYTLAVPNFFDVFSLKTKTITGQGLALPLVWSYSYGSGAHGLWGGAAPVPEHCSNTTICAISKTTLVTNPDGTKTRHRFGMMHKLNEGKLLGVSTLDAAGVVRREETTQYVSETEALSQPFPSIYGYAWGSDDPSATRIRPVVKTTVRQDGDIWNGNPDTETPPAPAPGDAPTFVNQVEVFDGVGRPTRVTRSSSLGYSRTETTSYLDDDIKWIRGQVLSVTCVAPCSQVMSTTVYDPVWRLPTSTTSFGKSQQSFTWNTTAGPQAGTLSIVRDGNNNPITVSDWKRGLPQLVQYPATPDQPAGATRSIAVRDEGWVGSVTDENAFATSYEYDPMGRVTRVIYPAGDSPTWTDTTQAFAQSATAEYGLPAGHWKQTVGTGNGSKTVRYDALLRPVVTETVDLGAPASTRSIVVARYDTGGRLAFQSYPLRTVTSYLDAALKGVRTEYDALGRVTATKQDSELGVLTSTTEYLTGFKTRTKSPRQQGTGDSTTTSFMAWDSPTTDYPVLITAPEGVVVTIGRDDYGKPKSLKRGNQSDGISITRSYVYNVREELCKSIEPETGATLMGYDGAGNLAWSAAGQLSGTACDAVPVVDRTQRTYDARNRVKSLVFPDNRGNTTYSYKPDGVLASIATHAAGLDVVTTTYDYNKRRLPTQEQLQVDAFTWPFVNFYNGNGHLASQSYPNGLSVDYAPNALGQPTQAGSYATGVAYHPNGGMSGFTYGNGVVHSMTQNMRQLPDRSIDSGGVLDDSYAYDGNGNVAAISDGLNGNRGDRDMTYDGLDRLTSTNSPMFTGGTLYTYDVLDNLIRVKAPGRDHTYVYDAKNLLSNVTVTGQGASVVGLGYDPQGNLNNKNGQLFDFDKGNRLRVATGKERYVYDGHGRRVRAVHETLGSIYSMYSQEGALRYQRDERKGTAVAYVSLNGSQVARVTAIVAPAVPALSTPGYVTTGSYTVQWTAVSSATSYELQERAGAGAWVQVQASAAISKAVSGKVSGLYDYRVRGCNAECGGWSAIASVSVELPPDAAPALTVPPTALNGNYTVSWSTPGGAQTYALQESVNGATWSTTYSGASTSQVFSSRPSGSYAYQVRTCNPAGCTGFSATKTVQVITIPGTAPVLSVPASNGNGSFTVAWSTIASATSYRLEESFNSGAWAEIDNTAATSKAVAGRITSGVYGYRVKACNAAGCGGYSAVASVTVLMPPTGAPAISVPASNGTGSFSVSWSAVSEATSYQIEQSIGGGGWALYYNGGAGSAGVSATSSGSYSYRGRACNASGCGPTGSAATTSVLLPPGTAPTLTAPASTANGDIALSWNAVLDGASYVAEELPPGGAWGQVYNGAGGSVLLTLRMAGTWQYRVKACNASGCGPYSATKVVTSTATPPPPVPTGLQRTQMGSMLCRIKWNASAGAVSYDLRSGSTVIYSGSVRTVDWDGICPPSLSVRACSATTCSGWTP